MASESSNGLRALVPLKIQSVLSAKFSEQKVIVDNYDITYLVKVMGYLIIWKAVTNNFTVTINDGTGSIQATYFSNNPDDITKLHFICICIFIFYIYCFCCFCLHITLKKYIIIAVFGRI